MFKLNPLFQFNLELKVKIVPRNTCQKGNYICKIDLAIVKKPRRLFEFRLFLVVISQSSENEHFYARVINSPSRLPYIVLILHIKTMLLDCSYFNLPTTCHSCQLAERSQRCLDKYMKRHSFQTLTIHRGNIEESMCIHMLQYRL